MSDFSENKEGFWREKKYPPQTCTREPKCCKYDYFGFISPEVS